MNAHHHTQIIQATKAAIEEAKEHPALAIANRFYEDDLRTLIAIHLHKQGARVRTPGTTSKCPDLVLNEEVGIQLKYSCFANSKSRMSISHARDDFEWFCQRNAPAHRSWSASRAWIVIWDAEKLLLRTKAYKDCVKADKVKWDTRRNYIQEIFEPIAPLIRWRNPSNRVIVFRKNLTHTKRVRVTTAHATPGYPYTIDLIGTPFGDDRWATVYSHLNIEPADEEITYAPHNALNEDALYDRHLEGTQGPRYLN